MESDNTRSELQPDLSTGVYFCDPILFGLYKLVDVIKYKNSKVNLIILIKIICRRF